MSSRDSGSSHILIVEDEIRARKAMVEMLKKKHYRISRAISGKHAVTKLSKANDENDKIDAVLMDIKMPGPLDGIDAACRIQQDHRDIPIIFVTAFADDPDYKERVRKAKLEVKWVDKPLIRKNKESLMGIIDKELKKKEARNELENALLNGISPIYLQKLLERYVSLYGINFLIEVILDIKRIYSSSLSNFDDLLAYLNLIAYKKMKTELEKTHSGQFVAFLDGSLVAHNRDRDDLIKSVFRKFERSDIFITRVVSGTKIIKLRRPMRVIR